MEQWFANWFNSPYYHLLYANRNEEEAAAFINKLIQYLHPPAGARMLDVACGKGRYSIQLADHGFDVTGIDLSEASIDLALPYQRENLHFYRHDMRQLFWINFFDYAFNFFTSFGYFRTQHENDSAMRTISRSLKPGGTFVLDYLNVNYAESHTIKESEKEINGVHFNISKWNDESYFYKKIEIIDKLKNQQPVFTEKVSKFKLSDFNEMISYHGMQIKEIFGNYNLGEYDIKNSPRLIILAQKVR
ncbi:MAG: class I SAM-dependent methyltransferase [Ferruginibacter sp.]|nr:class I SAM-dependent methyltransferase [Ferruginibacter sp.]